MSRGSNCEEHLVSRVQRDGEDEGVWCLLRTAQRDEKKHCMSIVPDAFWFYLLSKVVVSCVWIAAI